MKKVISLIMVLLGIICLQFNLTSYANISYKSINNNDNIKSLYNLELAKVKRVVDGDTIHIYTGNSITRVRLYGIDCMETSNVHRAYRQAYENNMTIEEVIEQGDVATKKLENIVKKNNDVIYFKTMGIDHYGRLLAIIYDKNYKNINDIMLETEACKVYVFNEN